MEASAISSAERPLDEFTLLDDLAEHAFAPSSDPPRVGVEIEMLVVRDQRAVSLAEFRAAIEPLIELRELEVTTVDGSPPCFHYGSISLTFEPGGQIEVVSAPRQSIATALEDVAKLEMLLDRVLMWQGMRRLHVGLNPWQEAAAIPLQTPLPRYRAMQEYFQRIGPEGARMMRLCCAIQINLDTGTQPQTGPRWRLANLLTPVLIGMFANSPISGGRASGWKSARSKVWRGVDPSRTGTIDGSAPIESYLGFALSAGLMLQRLPNGYRSGDPSFTFRDWMRYGLNGRRPTIDDWHYHLTTLFPQVRARGYLELRCVDALPVRWRAVPVAIASALILDDGVCEAATKLLDRHREELELLCAAAAQGGLDHPTVCDLAQCVMQLANQGFARMPEEWLSTEIVSTVHTFNELYTSRGRCPADDILANPGAPPW